MATKTKPSIRKTASRKPAVKKTAAAQKAAQPTAKAAEASAWGDLLSEPLLTLEDHSGGRRMVSLPGLYAALMAGEVAGLPNLRAHQQHGVHTFLVQLAALAVLKVGDIPQGVEAWSAALSALTPAGTDTAFHLVAPNDQPAFLQPPTPEADLAAFTREDCYDDIDVPLSGRAHVLKSGMDAEGAPENWVYALITKQTLSFYCGKFNYGIVRMNGGWSCRLFVGLTPSLKLSDHFRRDLQMLLDEREAILERHNFYRREGGIALVWCAPWDGETQLSLSELDCYFIEICRRLRLERDGDRLHALRGKSKKARIHQPGGKDGLCGRTGDPWAPLNVKRSSSVSVPLESGLTYDLVAQLLFDRETYQPSPAQEFQPDDQGDCHMVLRAITVDQGKTGYAERIIPMPRRTLLSLTRKREDAGLGGEVRQLLKDIEVAEYRLARPVLLAYLQDTIEKADYDRPADRPALKAAKAELSRRLDKNFFERLWYYLEIKEKNPEAARRQWLAWLIRQVMDSLVAGFVRRDSAAHLRALTKAQWVAEHLARRHFPEAFPESKSSQAPQIPKSSRKAA